MEQRVLFLKAVPHLVERDIVKLCSIYSAKVYSNIALQYDQFKNKKVFLHSERISTATALLNQIMTRSLYGNRPQRTEHKHISVTYSVKKGIKKGLVD